MATLCQPIKCYETFIDIEIIYTTHTEIYRLSRCPFIQFLLLLDDDGFEDFIVEGDADVQPFLGEVKVGGWQMVAWHRVCLAELGAHSFNSTADSLSGVGGTLPE